MANNYAPLAGIATDGNAARIGFSVDENVRRLLRFHWVERRLMGILVAHLTSEPVWEVKCALALHQWQCAEHVDALRRRIAEMRNPVPRLDAAPENDPTAAALDAFLGQVDAARDTEELLAGVYVVLYPALAAAYREHLERTNPLVDYPTRRILRFALVDLEEAVEWRVASDEWREVPHAWIDHLQAYLAAAGGVSGDAGVKQLDLTRHSPRLTRHSFHPQRDDRFHGQYNFEFAPHLVYNVPEVPADERNLALVCKRALEIDVPEMMASFMTERTEQPWEFYRDYSRQLWDEARHAMMGTVALEARGVDWKSDIPLNVSFALRLNLHATPIERQIMLYAIEQSLMPGETGKRFEYETALAAGDALSAHFQDYDWADEVLHAQIGRRALKREGISSDEACDRAKEIHEKTWGALDQYRSLDEQHDWWPEFVRKVLGKESAAQSRPGLNIFSE
ncbi:MAG TPA: hypothetical protein VH080_09750 [Gemmatimonadaceae bacterium]|nr:hypothetical protein [Gemmatimonadaceae bacterium]